MPNIKRANTSGITKSGVAIADVPDAPIIGSATATSSSTSTVSYTAATTGGTATTFTATSTPGSLTGTGSSPITVTGLTAETSYTFTVRASNSTGNSPFSSASNSITTPSPLSYDSIATVTVGSGGTSVITFSSIPSTYKHLQIRGIGRASTSQSATALADIRVRFNEDGNTNYARHRLLADGGSVSVGTATDQDQIPFSSVLPRSTSAGGIFGSFVIDILDYQNTNKYKTVKFFGGGDLNGSGGIISLQSALWRSNNAISSMTFTFETDSNPNPNAQYSKIALYGIKG